MTKPVFHHSRDNKQLESLEINTSDYSLTLKPYQKGMNREGFVSSQIEKLLYNNANLSRAEAEVEANKFIDQLDVKWVSNTGEPVKCFLVYATKLEEAQDLPGKLLSEEESAAFLANWKKSYQEEGKSEAYIDYMFEIMLSSNPAKEASPAAYIPIQYSNEQEIPLNIIPLSGALSHEARNAAIKAVFTDYANSLQLETPASIGGIIHDNHMKFYGAAIEESGCHFTPSGEDTISFMRNLSGAIPEATEA